MYGGSSGCYGMIIYNTKLKDENAVYGYYSGEEMCFETGTADELEEFKRQQRKLLPEGGRVSSVRVLVTMFFVFVAAVILGFVVLPLRIAFALMVFAVLAYMPLMVIIMANKERYADDCLQTSFRRFHGCEHAIISNLTKGKECTVESLIHGRIFDPECGTAYSGYAVLVAAELALLIVFWPGVLRSLGIIALTIVAIVVMILVPKINPFVLIQRPVVMRPTERECILGIEIVKRLKEL